MAFSKKAKIFLIILGGVIIFGIFLISSGFLKPKIDNLSVESTKESKDISETQLVEIQDKKEKEDRVREVFNFENVSLDEFKVISIEHPKRCPAFTNEVILTPTRMSLRQNRLWIYLETTECKNGEIAKVIAKVTKEDEREKTISEFTIDILANNLTRKKWLKQWRPNRKTLKKFAPGEYRIVIQALDGQEKILDQIESNLEITI